MAKSAFNLGCDEHNLYKIEERITESEARRAVAFGLASGLIHPPAGPVPGAPKLRAPAGKRDFKTIDPNWACSHGVPSDVPKPQ